MFNKIKKRNDHRKIFFDREFQSFFRFINKYSTRQFAVIAVIVATAVICTFEGFEYIYRQSVITRQTAVIQNEAVLIAAEYSNYESLEAAENNDMNSRLSSYSALNQIRIRIVNLNYVVSVDTYSIDTNKTILNPRVFDIFSNHKNSSGYDKKTGNIQAAVPVYNDSGKFIAVLVADLDYTEIDAMFHDVNSQNNNIKLVIITICLALLIVGIYFLNRPVKRVLDIVSNVSAGHTDERIPVRSYTEIREIADDFNNIMDRANETDQSRAEFVSNVSHELKTPITSMKVLADSLIQNESADLAMYKEFMTDIVDEIDRESKIITDLLTLVKMDKKSAAMNIEEIKINDLLEVILKRVTPIAKSRGIQITYESYRDVTAWVDEVKLSLALTNIIENAVKYNVDNGWVKVTLNADHRNFYVKVADSGVGIPDDCKEHVFERFYRVDKARSRDTGGTGLGLAITKSVIQMHKGSIKLYSESGEGTTFTIRIPMKSDASVDTARKEGDAE